MIVLKDYTIKEQNGIYYIITSSNSKLSGLWRRIEDPRQ